MKKTLAALLVFGGLVFNSAFAAVHSVENIPQKGEGDFLLASEINSILKTISGLLFDDASEILEVAGTVKATDFVKSDGTSIGGANFENIFESGQDVGIGTNTPSQNLDINNGNLEIRSSSPTVYFSDTNNRSGMIHVNSNLMYFLRGKGTGSEEWQSHNGRWPLYLNMENNNAHFGNEVHATKFVGDGSRLTGISTGSSKWSGSGNIYYSGGNVGVGTTSPSSKLEVVGNIKTIGGNLDLNFGDNNRLIVGYDRNIGDWVQLRPENAKGLAFLKGPDSHAMVVTNTGNVGIGTTSPSEKLHVSGKVKATSFVKSSDRNKKQNIKSLENVLQVVQTLRGVEFEWKENGQKSIGFIAQEVEEILPEIVHGAEGEKSVEYGNLTAILVEAVKAQQIQIQSLQKEVASLKK